MRGPYIQFIKCGKADARAMTRGKSTDDNNNQPTGKEMDRKIKNKLAPNQRMWAYIKQRQKGKNTKGGGEVNALVGLWAGVEEATTPGMTPPQTRSCPNRRGRQSNPSQS